MPRGATQARNHPRKGSSIKVEPIRDLAAIARIKAALRTRSPRDYCLFTLGINTAYRAGELLRLRIGQVEHLRRGDVLEIRQTKTKKNRAITLNGKAVESIQYWLAQHPTRDDAEAPLFLSRARRQPITVGTLCRLVKRWCAEAGLSGRYGSHSLRKSWGYHQRIREQTPLPILMQAFGHKTEAQTLSYLGIQPPEISELFLAMEL